MITYTAKPWLTSELKGSDMQQKIARMHAEELFSQATEKGIAVPSIEDLLTKWLWAIDDALTCLKWDDEFEFAE